MIRKTESGRGPSEKMIEPVSSIVASTGTEFKTMPLVAEFYGLENWQTFVFVALVGLLPGDPGVAARAHEALATNGLDSSVQRRGPEAAAAAPMPPAPAPEAFCLDGSGEAQRLLVALRVQTPQTCEPLRVASTQAKLLGPYWSIRQ